MRLAVLLASHNRAEITRRCLLSFMRAADSIGVDVQFFVFDDGSTDSTQDVVLEVSPTAIILRGDGSNYWARSMSKAEEAALETPGLFDYIVWLNDDVVIDDDALGRFIEVAAVDPYCVFVGGVRDPATGEVTYSGYKSSSSWRVLHFERVVPTSEPVPIDTFNGNLVFVPVPLAVKVGGIESRYAHAMADLDYGLRCKNLGAPVRLLPGTFGVCARNPPRHPGTFSADWRYFLGPKGGGHVGSNRLFLQRHGGFSWRVELVAIYCVWLTRRVRLSIRRAAKGRAGT